MSIHRRDCPGRHTSGFIPRTPTGSADQPVHRLPDTRDTWRVSLKECETRALDSPRPR